MQITRPWICYGRPCLVVCIVWAHLTTKTMVFCLRGAAADANKPHNKGKQSVTLLNLWPFVWYPDHKSVSGLYSTLIHLWWPAMFGHYGALKVIWRSYPSHWCKITLKLPGRQALNQFFKSLFKRDKKLFAYSVIVQMLEFSENSYIGTF